MLMAIRSLIELFAIIALLYGLQHEKAVAEWEQKICGELSEMWRRNNAKN